MSHIKANELLPPELIREIQKYIQGIQIYIPKKNKTRLGWGYKNGTRKRLNIRNAEIRALKKAGRSVEELAGMYYLSTDSIRKIIY